LLQPLPLFDIAREWGLTTKENPSQDVRKNKATADGIRIASAIFIRQSPDYSGLCRFRGLANIRPLKA
jgi:hypothetical protein